MIKVIKEIINNNKLEEILKERDIYEVGSPEWNILNSVKSFSIESSKPSTRETIIAFKEADLENIPEGLTLNVELGNMDYTLIRRAEAEYHPVYRHPIPYIVVRHEDKYFFILREKGSGEARLIGKKGMLGGHVSAEDLDGKTDLSYAILKSMQRELEEEAGITDDMVSNIKFLGTLKSNVGVDADHLGLIFLIDINTDNIKSEEEGVLTGIWIDRKDLEKHADQFESWSKIIYENILKNI